MLVCTLGAAFEMNSEVVWDVSEDITHSSFRACMHCMY